MNRKSITPRIEISDQPSEEDLANLRREGFDAIVNLRHPGEPDQPLGPAEEGEQARALGMDYLHTGVGGAPLAEETVAAVHAFLDRHEAGKVLVHCKLGGRAAALVLLHRAKSEGWGPDEVFEKGRAQGLEVTGKLKDLVAEYLAREAGRS